ncbi:MAG: hypothetical protein U5K79_05780 [Cyclobacteriaceae bacterium]|nr:hypothetical protein [Cyclobacteriaceae bacterium]
MTKNNEMNFQNKISTTISDTDINEILAAINYIHKKLPGLVSLTELELASLPKPNSDTIEFVYENLKLAEESPELVPDFVDLKELKKDVDLVKAIEKILCPIKDLVQVLEDSATLAGSEAYLPSIAIYNSVKTDAIRRKRAKKTINA